MLRIAGFIGVIAVFSIDNEHLGMMSIMAGMLISTFTPKPVAVPLKYLDAVPAPVAENEERPVERVQLEAAFHDH